MPPPLERWIRLVVISTLAVHIHSSPQSVMPFPETGVYSLFPHEDLRTGKSIRRPAPLLEPTDSISRSSGFTSSRTRGNRVIFDDERLNFRGHFDSREHINVGPRLERLREERRFDIPVLPAYSQSRLPPRALEDTPTKIRVFTPEGSTSLELPRPDSLDTYDEVKPGRLFLPGRNRPGPFLNLREPGTDNFINHDDFLDYHTKAAISAVSSFERSRERPSKSQQLLFSSQIHGLIPPSPSASFSPSPHDSASIEGPFVRSKESFEPSTSFELTPPKVHISSLLEPLPPRLQGLQNPVLESGFIPINNYIGSPRPRRPNGDEEQSRTLNKTSPKTIAVETSTEAVATEETTIATTIKPNRRYNYPYVKKSGTVSRVFPTTTLSPVLEPIEDDETITFAPSFDDFVGPRSSAEFSATKIRTEAPLILLETPSPDLESGKSEKNVIFIKRLKNPKNPERISKSKTGIESKMMIVRTGMSSSVTSDEPEGSRSTSPNGVVARVHAHVSRCPKLEAAAEILCDVHIRKRHGSQNPQLVVGWKRKFHNTTKEDILLAVNTTLAYIEEDFHDKFNVTLAAGISPMLRSVLSITSVQPNDTGNYQCQVDDGFNVLRSDTLLFLCH